MGQVQILKLVQDSSYHQVFSVEEVHIDLHIGLGDHQVGVLDLELDEHRPVGDFGDIPGVLGDLIPDFDEESHIEALLGLLCRVHDEGDVFFEPYFHESEVVEALDPALELLDEEEFVIGENLLGFVSGS